MADALNTADAVAKDCGKSIVVGNPDDWQLLTKFMSADKMLMKSSKAYEILGVGCLVQVSTRQNFRVAEALQFVPGVKVVDDVNGGKKLIRDVHGSDPM